MSKARPVAAAAALYAAMILAGHTAYAQPPADKDADKDAATGVFYLGHVDVDVTGKAPSVSGITVVDQKENEQLGARTVSESLAAVPGITLNRVGPRNEGMVYLRGFDLRQIPLFIDGVPVYVPYDGYVDLDRFVTSDLSEVRVTKGMTSSLIGPNALGGAINLVTKRPSKPFEGLFDVMYGTGSERNFDANLGRAGNGWYAYGTGSWLQADNFPLSDDFVPNALEDGGARNNSSRRDAKASLKFALTPSGKGEYVVSYVLQRGQKDVPPYAGTNAAVKPRFWQWPDWNKDSVYAVANTPLRGTRYLRGRAYYDRFYNELDSFDDAKYTTQLKPSAFRSIYDDYTGGGSAEYGGTLPGKQTLRVAGSLKEDIHREHNIGEPIRHFNIRTVSAGLEDSVELSGNVTFVAGISVDHQSTVQAENFINGVVSDFPAGSAGGVNPQAALYIGTPYGGRARLEVYHKTRLPAIKDRYSYRMGAAIPNADLKAERATTAEIGYDMPLMKKAGTVALTGYYTAVNDLVQPFFVQPTVFQLQNVGDVRNSGAEAEWRVPPVRHVQASVGYAYLHRENVNGTTAPLLNTPHHKVFAYATYDGIPRLQLVASVNHESSRTSQDDASVLQSLDGFSTAMAKASLKITRGLSADVSGANLFDANYQLYSGFPEAGRVLSANLRFAF